MKSSGVLLCFLLLLCGCAGQQVASPAVEKSAPVVYIYPLQPLARPASVAVLPFQMPPAGNPAWGEAVALLFKDVMLGKRAFRTVRFVQQPWSSLADAAAAGRRAGVDYVLAGRVTRLVEGYELGGGMAEVAVRLLATGRGDTVWYVGQSMTQPPAYPRSDFAAELRSAFSFSYPSRLPVDKSVTTNMLLRMAEDLTDVMAGVRSVGR